MDGKTHRLVGAGTGLVIGAIRSDGQESWKQLAEAVGGAIGGYAGACLPDILEPATHSWHRDVCHSVTMGAGVVAGARKTVGSWESRCRELADQFAAKRSADGVTDLERVLAWLGEIFFRVAAGVLAGAAGGYVSHLVLDGATPRGIPLLSQRLV